MDGPRYKLRRSWRDAAFAAGLSTPFAALAAWAVWAGHPWAGVLSGAVAAAGLGLAAFATLEAPCPNCGRWIHHLLPGRNEYVRCGHCARYARGEEGELWAMEADHVAEEPVFALEVQEGLKLPRLCCVCAAPAVKDEESALTVREIEPGGLSTPAANRRYVVRVPHCDGHEKGAVLTRENVAPATGFSRDAVVSGPAVRLANVVKVRSYRFYLAALESVRAS